MRNDGGYDGRRSGTLRRRITCGSKLNCRRRRRIIVGNNFRSPLPSSLLQCSTHILQVYGLKGKRTVAREAEGATERAKGVMIVPRTSLARFVVCSRWVRSLFFRLPPPPPHDSVYHPRSSPPSRRRWHFGFVTQETIPSSNQRHFGGIRFVLHSAAHKMIKRNGIEDVLECRKPRSLRVMYRKEGPRVERLLDFSQG